MKEFFEKYVKPNRKYFITSDTAATTFLTTGAIIKELKNPRYKVYRYPGKELLETRKELTKEEFAKSNKIHDYIVLSNKDKDVVATYPMQLLYIIEPELYEKYKNTPVINLEKVVKNKNKDPVETEKFFRENEDYVLKDILYTESLVYYPLLREIVDSEEFEKYIITYPDTKKEKLPENLEKLPTEERVKEANNYHMTVLFIHKNTSTPLTMPIGTFMVIEPWLAKKIAKTFKKITPEEFISLLQEKLAEKE